MKLKDWDKRERPREKLLRLGAGALGNAELLAIFVHAGQVGRNAVDIGQELLSSAGGRLSDLCDREPEALTAYKGVGPARAAAIAAALELGKRYFAEKAAELPVINGPDDVYKLLIPKLKGLDHEECWVLYLNRANIVTGQERVTSGTADSTLIDPKFILRGVVKRQAKAVILVHNHPSGSPLPGEADLRETRRLQLALKALDTALYDHVIFTDGAYYSFQEERVTKKRL